MSAAVRLVAVPALCWACTACASVPAVAPDRWPVGPACAADGGTIDLETRYDLEADDGVPLRVYVRAPVGARCLPAAVLVPPGFEPGGTLVSDALADALVAEGVVVVSFDPRGRGESGGAEDANGALGQDDLAAVLRFAAWQEEVDPARVVLYSRSFGGALAAGALSRHAELAVVGWVDAESPGWLRSEVESIDPFARDTLLAQVDPTDPDAWWAEREPAGLIGGVRVPYHRLQGLPDHALGNYVAHAVAMVDGATAAPERRFDGQPVEGPFDEEAARALTSGRLDPGGAEVVAVLSAP